jgi:hypothetical protein
VQPDNRAINGMVGFADTVATSSKLGSLYRLSGQSAKDFAFDPLYPMSGAAGDESLAYVGNDIVYGRQGRVESLFSTQKFGDVETDDLSVYISDQVSAVTGWTTVYNSRTQRVHLLPDDGSEMWVLHKPLVGTGVSPWMRWTTAHALDMQPTAIMNCYDPADGLEYIFMGDASGNLYRLEGTAGGDADAPITMEFLSNIIRLPMDAQTFNVQGYIAYRKGQAFTVTMRFEYSGKQVFNETISVNCEAADWLYWGGSQYWGGSNFWGSAFAERIHRRPFGVPGQSNEFQVRITVTGTEAVTINEIGVRFEAAA